MKKNIVLKFLLMFFVVVLAYGQTANMYFWQDDSALIFKLQHPNEGVGSFGTGILGQDSPYRYLVTPFVPLYPLFHLEPRGYFIVGILLYFLSAVSVYFLAKQFTKNNLVSLMAGLIYSSGYIGSDTMWRIINSYQTSLTIILICIALIMYKRYIEKKGILLFIIALLSFVATIEFGFVRGHGILLFIIGMELLYNFSLIYSPLRLLPFLGLFYHWYLDGNSSSRFGPILIQKLLHGDFTPIGIYLQTLRNLFIPDWIPFSLGLFIFILIAVLLWKRSRILLFSLVIMLGTYVVYFVQYQDQSFSTTQRYLTPSFIGLSIFIAVLLSLIIKNKKLYVISVGVIMLFYLFQVNVIESQIVAQRSIPARKFYVTLKHEIKHLQKGSLIYFDIKNDGKSQIEFGSFFGVGSMPESTAVAIYYGIDRYDVALPGTFDDLLSMIQKYHTDPKKVYTFTYDAVAGLKNTTTLTRKQLFTQNDSITVTNPEAINQKMLVPFQADVDLAINADDIKFASGQPDGKLKDYLAYLIEKQQYYATVTATSSSYWQDSYSSKLVDNDVATSWMGHRIYWNDLKKDSVTINLGEQKSVGGIILTTGSAPRVPIEYTYSCSMDNQTFTPIKKVSITDKIGENARLFDTFSPVTCQYIKMLITKVYINDSPQVAEVEVVPSDFSSLNLERAEEIRNDPYAFVYGEEDKQALVEFFNEVGYPVDICIYTNKHTSMHDAFCKSIRTSGGENTIIFPQSGSVLKQMFVESVPQINVNIVSAKITPLSFKELQNSNDIKIMRDN